MLLSLNDIADLIGISFKSLKDRSRYESWPHTAGTNPCTGRRCKLFQLDNLPQDIRDKIAGNNKLDALPEKTRTQTIARYQLLQQYRRSKLTIGTFVETYNTSTDDTIQELRNTLGTISIATLKRWKAAYKKKGLCGLIPRHAQKKTSNSTLTEEEQQLIESYYLTTSKPSLMSVLTTIKTIHKKDIPYHKAYRHIKNIPRPVVKLKREGKKAYNDSSAPYINRKNWYNQIKAMDWICGDNRTLDILIRTEDNKKQRPYISAFIDLRSRKLIGYHIDTTANSLTITAALHKAVKKYGAPKHIYIDNGKDYTAQILTGNAETKGILAELGTEIHHALPYWAQSKPIERWFATMANYFDKHLTGYVGSNTKTRPEEIKELYTTAKEKQDQLMTLEELKEAFKNFVKFWNREHKHRGSGMNNRTPDQIFASTWEEKREVPAWAERLIFSQKYTRKVGRNGITINSIQYYTEELAPYKHRTITARIPVADTSECYIYDQEGKYICTAYADILAGTSAQHIKRIKEARKKELAILLKKYRHIEELQSTLPTWQDYLLTEEQEEENIRPKSTKVVGLPVEQPTLHVVKKGRPHKKRKIETLF